MKRRYDKKVANRVKLFMMFDSLKGFKELLLEEEKKHHVVPMIELSEDELYELNWKINSLKPGMMITVMYRYGEYCLKVEGMVSHIDLTGKKYIQIVKKKIPVKDIVKIEM